jgi:hypothetical protein
MEEVSIENGRKKDNEQVKEKERKEQMWKKAYREYIT